jgi:iron complex outermembrane recepter protein
MSMFGLFNNGLNQHYAAGTFFSVNNASGFLGLSDPRTFFSGMPFAAYAGLRARF